METKPATKDGFSKQLSLLLALVSPCLTGFQCLNLWSGEQENLNLVSGGEKIQSHCCIVI